MATTPTSGSRAPDKQAYAEAMQMLRHEGTMLWQRFSAFLVVHGLFAALLAHAALDTRPHRPLVAFGSLAGLALCWVWLSTFRRGNAFFDLRVAQATHFEPSEWKIIAGDGKTFSEGGVVTIDGESRKMDPIGRCRMRYMVYVAIFILAATYVVLAAVTFCGSPDQAGGPGSRPAFVR